MGYKTGHWGEQAKARSTKRKAYFSQHRNKALDHLGAICKHCSNTDRRVLQIDHINGGGGKEWKGLGQSRRYQMVLVNPQNYQVLCANCNYIKRYEKRELRRQAGE